MLFKFQLKRFLHFLVVRSLLCQVFLVCVSLTNFVMETRLSLFSSPCNMLTNLTKTLGLEMDKYYISYTTMRQYPREMKKDKKNCYWVHGILWFILVAITWTGIGALWGDTFQKLFVWKVRRVMSYVTLNSSHFLRYHTNFHTSFCTKIIDYCHRIDESGT